MTGNRKQPTSLDAALIRNSSRGGGVAARHSRLQRGASKGLFCEGGLTPLQDDYDVRVQRAPSAIVGKTENDFQHVA